MFKLGREVKKIGGGKNAYLYFKCFKNGLPSSAATDKNHTPVERSLMNVMFYI